MSRNSPVLFPLLLGALAPIGGQAVLEGVMLRNGDLYSLAVRTKNGDIRSQRLPWRSFLSSSWLRWPFIRGFPILLETVVNGIQALNRSASLAESAPREASGSTFLSILLAMILATGLFILVPHFLSFLMISLHIGGDVDGISFHIWDGFYKVAVFLLYVWAISLVPDIRRVFEYHGAEHKAVHAWEELAFIDKQRAAAMNRLHPRCGTTFLLFVVLISIFLQALLVPFILGFVQPAGPLALHGLGLAIKLALVIPVSAIAYEIINWAASLRPTILTALFQFPGLWLQKFTTKEPTPDELDVAIVALAEAVDYEEVDTIVTVPYHRVQESFSAIDTL